MKLNKLVDRTVILTLDKRLDLGYALSWYLYQIGISAEIFIGGDGLISQMGYDHIDVLHGPPAFKESIQYASWWKPNAFNAWLCHNKILAQAKHDKIKTLFLLEDDAFLEDDFSEILDKVFATKFDWDMLYLGGYHRQGSWDYTDNDHLIRVKGSGGWHGVLIKENVISRLLEFPPIGPYDWICGNHIHNNYACYAVYPSIVSQRDNQFSYVEGCNLKKPSRYER